MNTTDPRNPVTAPTFPFGRPVLPSPAIPAGNRDVLVLGSAPGALCMRWRAPGGKLVQAFPVDNEPTPFWNGHDQEAQVRRWREVVCWQGACGDAGPSRQNGQQGRWLDEVVLAPLDLGRERMVAATLLPTYHANEAARARIDEMYQPLTARLALPACALPAMPGGDELVAAGLGDERERLLALLAGPGLRTLITLGMPAFRVLGHLLGADAAQVSPAILGDGPGYGRPQAVRWQGRELRWFAFVSPVAPGSMLRLHQAWAQQQSGVRPLMMVGAFK